VAYWTKVVPKKRASNSLYFAVHSTLPVSRSSSLRLFEPEGELTELGHHSGDAASMFFSEISHFISPGNHPLQGMIKVSSAPMHKALEHLGQ